MHRERDHRRPTRLDVRVVDLGLAPSRARARDLIRRGLIEVAGAVATKPGAGVAADVPIRLCGPAATYASRGSQKLVAALEHFSFPTVGLVALDVGASAGGFTEVLLAGGARRVYAVDVGHGQLDARLARDARVVSLEGCDARSLDRALISESIDAITADVSFISLTKALPVPLALAHPGSWLVALIKPQFEVGRAAVGKGGVVREPAARQRAVDLVCDWLGAQAGWRVHGVIPSPIAGGSGNVEFLLGAVRDE
jgi:23S rRNA (cytidine1920-2'-O)/16S rRNA (cytidine1409-2'-O)-methyltransferase